MRQIKFTAAEADVWDWAVDPAREYWEDDDGRDDGKHFDESPVRFTENGIAQYDDSDPEVIEDMIYRIGTQLREMAREQGGFHPDGRPDADAVEARSILPVINRVVRKMKASTPTNQPA
jgi:hypothetical protein